MSRHSEAVAPVRRSGPLSVWGTWHASNAVAALGRMVRQPFASLMIVLVIAVTLALPAALNLLVKNARAISGGWDSALDFSVFLDMEVAENVAQSLADLLQQRADVESATLVTAEQAMREFKASSGFGAARRPCRVASR